MKKNMRKVAALGLCVALGATMLTACGGSKGKSASGGKTELNFGIWDENQRPAMEKMVKAYEKENSDVKINIQLTPYKGGEYWTKLEAAASGGKAPDVFWLNVLHLDSYVEGGILDDLTDKIKDSDIKDSYSETLVNNYVRDKKNYAVPKDFDTNALWYNKEIFDKCGVPYPTDDMSYDDLVATAKALKDSGKVTVTATFEKNKKPLDGVSAQFEFNLSKDDNIIPFTSQTMYQVFSGKEEGALTKADLAAKTEINLSDKGLTDTEVAYLQYATGCEKLDLSKNTNISKIDALKSMINLKEPCS